MNPPRKKDAPRAPSLLDWALALVLLGYAVFLCQPKGKKPLLKGHGFKDATKDPEQVKKWWTKYPTANIGLIPGTAGHVVIDIDGPEGRAEAEQFGLLQSKTLTVTTGRGLHLYFLCPEGAEFSNKDLSDHINVRHFKGYVMGPGSIHPSGHVYAWVDEEAEALPLPAHIAAILLGTARAAGSKPAKRAERSAASRTAAMSTLLEVVHDVGRNNALTSYLGRIRRTGAEEEELFEAGLVFNEAYCVPPLSEAEVRSVAQSIAKYPCIREETEELNRTYAVVLVGSKGRILYEHGDTLSFLGSSDFYLMLQNRAIASVGRNGKLSIVPLARVWLEDPQRRQYARLVFEPGGTATEDAYNLWRGWGVQPKAGDCSLFLAHLRDNICSGDEELFRWVLAWFAHILRFPRVKLGTALVLRGRQGTGKSIVGEIFGKIIGQAFLKVSMARHLTGNFNALLGERILVQAEEAFWAGDRTAEGVLKDLITSATIVIERKGIDPDPTANYVRLFVTSNSRWVIPAGVEERRFAVVHVSDAHIQDHAYFGALMAQMEHGGYEALFQHCLDLNLDDVDLRTIPQTAALTEQKLSSLSPELAWWCDTLARGYLAGDRDGSGLVAKADLYAHYVEHAEHVGTRWKSIETLIGIFLTDHVDGLVRCRDKVDDKRGVVPCYRFPSLAKCREQFARMIQHIEWEEPLAWQTDPKLVF